MGRVLRADCFSKSLNLIDLSKRYFGISFFDKSRMKIVEFMRDFLHINNKNKGEFIMGKSFTMQGYRDTIQERFNGSITILSNEYKTRKTKLSTQCNQCGTIWETTPDTLLRAKHGCPNCAQLQHVHHTPNKISQGEVLVRELLDINKIAYIPQFVFSSLKSITGNFLFFDFAIIFNDEILYLIEVNGKQHYQQAGFYTDEQYKKLQENDLIKKQFCIDNNIPFIIITSEQLKNLTIKDLTLS